MLNELCKEDKQWREIAFNICKNKQLADDITQEMYLRIYKYNPKKDARQPLLKMIDKIDRLVK